MNQAQNLKAKRKDGLYHLDDKCYVSVTTVFNVLYREGLERWKMKLLHQVLQEDSTLSFEQALAKLDEVSYKARDRGTAVHAIVESYNHLKRPDLDSYPLEHRPYAHAFYNWIDDNDLEFVSRERTVFSNKYGFAGTLDVLAKMGKSGKTYILDIKTGKNIYPEATWQLSAYQQALAEEGVETDGLAVLLLKENGKAQFEYQTPDFTMFRAIQHVWEKQNPTKAKQLTKSINLQNANLLRNNIGRGVSI